jgi:hypothetical protein
VTVPVLVLLLALALWLWLWRWAAVAVRPEPPGLPAAGGWVARVCPPQPASPAQATTTQS